MDKFNDDFICIGEKFLKFLKGMGYKDSTLLRISRKINQLFIFLNEKNMPLNKNGINLYLSSVLKREDIVDSTKLSIKYAMIRFIDYLEGKYIPLHPYNQVILPSISDVNRKILGDYIEECINNGNKPPTIKQKTVVITRFINECEKKNVDLNCLNGTVLRDILFIFNKGKGNIWPIISNYLLYLFKNGYLEKDLSLLIPKIKKKEVIPTVYTIDEIKRIEKVIDTSTFKGKRDKVAFLLASRLGIRTSDIINLKAENIDFEKNLISFTQIKTGKPITLPIVEDLKVALLDYIKEREKINSSSDNLLVCVRLSNKSIDDGSVLRNSFKQYFKKAGIDISNRKHGLHSLRSSLASSMVNDEVPYDIVRKVLGHDDPDAIKHYAKLDIEELRRCALEVPAPSGRFEAFLKGGLKDE